MEKSLQVFSFEGRETRVVMRNGDPWWVAKDVCDVLEIVNARDAISALDDDEKANVGNSDVASLLGLEPNPTLYPQGLNIINESGLYALIMRSNKPEAKKFRKWITSEVLPSIRKTGEYSMKSKTADLTELRLAVETKKTNVNAAKILQRMIEHPAYPLTDDSKRVLTREVAKLLTGYSCAEMLPDSTERLYSNSDLGEEMGVNNRAVMKLGRSLELVAPEGESNDYGTWKMSKSPHSPHECPQWFWKKKGREKLIPKNKDNTAA